MTRTPSAYLFAVHERGLCAWDHDLVGRTLQFLDGVDTDYFEAVAELLGELLETQRGSAASIALRSYYRQGTEALMSLLGAAMQAPACVPTWIASCSTGDLRAVVAALNEGTPLLTTSGRRRVTFDELSERIHRHAWTGEMEEPSTASRFGRFWSRLAADFLDDIPTAEYNALKHGLRVRPGGFRMSIGPQRQQGERAHPESMLSLGGSPHGSTFIRVEAIGHAKSNVRARRVSVNWSAESMVQRLAIISMSITNVVSRVMKSGRFGRSTIDLPGALRRRIGPYQRSSAPC